jgi:hypothetical protein
MWQREKEYFISELLDHPALTLMLSGEGLDRRSVELLLETGGDERDCEPCRIDQPIVV